MPDQSFKEIRSRLPVIQEKLRALRDQLNQIVVIINQGRMIPDDLTRSVMDSLQACKQEESFLFDLAGSINLSIQDDTFEEIANKVTALEAQENREHILSIIQDFFRLTSKAQDTIDALEESKKNLQKICSLVGPELEKSVYPYSLVVEHTRNEDALSDVEYDQVQSELGRKIVRAIDMGKLFIDESVDISDWMAPLIHDRVTEKFDTDLETIKSTTEHDLPKSDLAEELSIPSGASIKNSVIADVPCEDNILISDESDGFNAESVESISKNPDELNSKSDDNSSDSNLDTSDQFLANREQTFSGPVSTEENTMDAGLSSSDESSSINTDIGLDETPVHNQWMNYSSYLPKEIDISIEKDVPESEAKANKFINQLRENPDLFFGLHFLAHVRLFSADTTNPAYESFPVTSRKNLDMLVSRGYCSILSIKTERSQKSYYIISRKGLSCLKKSDVIRYLKSTPMKQLLLPADLLIHVSEFTYAFLYRCSLISDFILSHYTDQYVLIDHGDPDRDYSFCSYTPNNMPTLTIATGLFVHDQEKKNVDMITSYLKEPDHSLLLLLVEHKSDIPILHNVICSENPDFCDSLIYSVVGETDELLNGNLETVMLDPDHVPDDIHDPIEINHDNQVKPVDDVMPDDLSVNALSDLISQNLYQQDISDKLPESEDKSEPVSSDTAIVQQGKKYIAIASTAYKKKRFDVGNVLLKSVCKYLPEIVPLEKQYSYATGDPMNTSDYRPSNLVEAFPDEKGESTEKDCLFAASWLRMLFSSAAGYESYLAGSNDHTQNISIFDIAPDLRNLFYTLADWVKNHGRGIDSYLLEEALRHHGTENVVHDCQQRASDLLQSGALLRSSHYARRIKKLRELLFSSGSELDEALRAVAENDKSLLGSVKSNIANYISIDDYSCTVKHNSLEKLMDDTWKQTQHVAKGNGVSTLLTGNERSTLRNQLINVFTIIGDWVIISDKSVQLTSENHSSIVTLINTCIPLINSSINQLNGARYENDTVSGAIMILTESLIEIKERIEGNLSEDSRLKFFYIQLLKEPFVALNVDYMPYIEDISEQMNPFEFCAKVSMYLNSLDHSWKSVIERYFAIDSRHLGSDYGCAQVLKTYLEQEHPEVHWPAEYDITRATERALDKTSRRGDSVYLVEQNFTARLEMADGDGWFSKTTDREHIDKVRNACYTAYYSNDNFGFYMRKLQDLLKNAQANASLLRSQYVQRLERQMEYLSEEEKKAPIFGRIMELINSDRFGAVESYLQQIDRGNLEISNDGLGDPNSYFNRFVNRCGQLCHSAALTVKLDEAFKNCHRNIKNRTVTTGEAMLKSWPTGITNAANIGNVMLNLGLNGKVTSENADNRFFMTFSDIGRVENYSHPIADFGSKMFKNGLLISVILGRKDTDTLFSDMNSVLQKVMNRSVLFIVNYAITLQERRKLARKIATNNRTTCPCLLLDRALAFFLADFPVSERWKILIQCAIPFQPVQLQNPYNENSSIEIPPDMFIGRREELSSIIDPNGANLIYGGRQLGKTALLQRARTLQNLPDLHSWSVYVDVKNMDCATASNKVINALMQDGFLTKKPASLSWESLVEEIELRMMAPDHREDHLLLLIDEADYLLHSFDDSSYHELDLFKRLQNTTSGRFKFVMAGLHNVLRLSQKALEQNSGLPQLQGITVKPLSFSDARELLEIPLSYLGFMIPAGEEDIIAQILYNTNYFPGLVHFYASRLVRHMQKNASPATMPPYMLDREVLTRILADEDFRKMRVQRLKMTLGIDADEHSYYDSLAHVLCYSSLESEDVMLYGMTADEIRKECYDLSPESRIAGLGAARIEALLDELVDLNILRREITQGKNRFLFSRASFIEMLGSKEEVENHLLEVLTR